MVEGRGGVVVPREEGDGTGDVNKRVYAVEDGEEWHVAFEEPGLDFDFFQGKEQGEEGVVLRPKDLKTVLLGEIPDATTGSHDGRGKFLGDNVEEEVHGPVEHLDEEGKFAQNSRVDVSGKFGGIGGVDGGDATA